MSSPGPCERSQGAPVNGCLGTEAKATSQWLPWLCYQGNRPMAAQQRQQIAALAAQPRRSSQWLHELRSQGTPANGCLGTEAKAISQWLPWLYYQGNPLKPKPPVNGCLGSATKAANKRLPWLHNQGVPANGCLGRPPIRPNPASQLGIWDNKLPDLCPDACRPTSPATWDSKHQDRSPECLPNPARLPGVPDAREAPQQHCRTPPRLPVPSPASPSAEGFPEDPQAPQNAHKQSGEQ